MAQSLADAGAITPDEVAKHPSRHVLTGALATRGAFAHVQLRRARLEDGDRLLLCSDGLTEMVPEDAIAGVLRSPGPSSDACRTLVDLALEAGRQGQRHGRPRAIQDTGASAPQRSARVLHPMRANRRLTRSLRSRFPRREPPPSLRSGDYSRRER